MLQISDKAILELKNLIKESSPDTKAGLKVFGQAQGCCSSNQLGIELVDLTENKLPVYDYNGLTVVMDDEAKKISTPATIDFFEHSENPGFRVLWNKSEGSCGCS